jgi:hypothetical protein
MHGGKAGRRADARGLHECCNCPAVTRAQRCARVGGMPSVDVPSGERGTFERRPGETKDALCEWVKHAIGRALQMSFGQSFWGRRPLCNLKSHGLSPTTHSDEDRLFSDEYCELMLNSIMA